MVLTAKGRKSQDTPEESSSWLEMEMGDMQACPSVAQQLAAANRNRIVSPGWRQCTSCPPPRAKAPVPPQQW